MFGSTELLVILVITILFFGAKKFPQLGRAFGRSVREFKKGLQEEEIDVTETSRQAKLKQEAKENEERS